MQSQDSRTRLISTILVQRAYTSNDENSRTKLQNIVADSTAEHDVQAVAQGGPTGGPAAVRTHLQWAARTPESREKFSRNVESTEPLECGQAPLGESNKSQFSRERPQSPSSSAAESAAFWPSNAPLDPALANLIDTWPTLPDEIKQRNLAIVRSATSA